VDVDVDVVVVVVVNVNGWMVWDSRAFVCAWEMLMDAGSSAGAGAGAGADVLVLVCGDGGSRPGRAGGEGKGSQDRAGHGRTWKVTHNNSNSNARQSKDPVAVENERPGLPQVR
jgi:hypothetical protein